MTSPKTCEGGDTQIVHLLHDSAQSLSLPLRHDYIFILFLSQGRLAIHIEDKVKNKSRDSREVSNRNGLVDHVVVEIIFVLHVDRIGIATMGIV